MSEYITKYQAATITCDPKLGMKEYNIKEQLALVEEAAQNGAKLIALPEMANIGYCWYNREEIAPYVEPIPGETTEAFAAIAKKYGCYIVVGLGEVGEHNVYYNSAALVGPEGVVGVHRKSHNYVCEGRWAKDGNADHMVWDTPIGRIGMLVCMDINIMETARLEGVRGADVIVCISNWVEDKCPAMTWITRAYENGCYVVVSDRCGLERGTEFNGGSCIIDPDGIIQAIADDGPSIAYAEIDIEKARDKSFFGYGNKMLDRKPEEYMDITLDPYLWEPLLSHGLYNHDPLTDGKKSKVGVIQMSPKPGDIRANLEEIKKRAWKLVEDDDAELIVTPELSLCGFDTPENMKKMADTVPGCVSDEILEFCYRYRVYLIVGLVEKEENRYYNTAVLYSPEGILGKYRKIHLDQNDEGWATPGDMGLTYINTSFGRLGMLIGHDADFSETARIHALHGVDIICCPAAVSGPLPGGLPQSNTWHKKVEPYAYTHAWWHLWRVRGGENNCYVLFANAIGSLADGRTAMGYSGIFQPMIWVYPRQEVLLNGKDIDQATQEIDTCSYVLNGTPTGNTRKKYLMPMRKPIWYDPLVDKNYPAK